MPSPEASPRRVEHFTSRLQGGDEHTAIYSEEVDGAIKYEAHGATAMRGERRIVGSLTVVKHGRNAEITSAILPEPSESDPLAPKRALSLLVFSLLKEEEARNGKRRGDEILFVDPEDRTFRDRVFRHALGLRQRATGRLTGERELRVAKEKPLDDVAGLIEDTLLETQTYVSPFPAGTDSDLRASA
jgi:hypothetical protein